MINWDLFYKHKYNIEIPPTDESRTETGLTQTSVNSSIVILDITDINEENSLISLTFTITLQWKDPQLTFSFLKDSDTSTFIEKDKKNIWTPKLKVLLTKWVQEID